MRLSARMVVAALCAVLLAPALNLFADEPFGTDPDESVMTPVMPMAAMSGAAMPYSRGQNAFTPRVELFMGYSYLRAVPKLADGNRMVWLNGGSTSVAFNFNRYLGIVGDFGGFNDTRLRLGSATGTAPTVADSSGTAYTYLAGPRLSFRNHGRITPFAQALFGGVHASDVTLSSGCSGAGCTLLPAENSFALTAGGGLDIRVRRHLAIRLIQAEYLMTRFDNFNSGTIATQNDMRLSSGIVFRFGGNPAQRLADLSPLAYSCSVRPLSVYQGDPIAVSGTAVNLDPAKTANYSWSVDGGIVSGSSSTARIDTSNVAAGAYTLKGHVSEGEKIRDNADCTAPFVVKAIEPPTVSCTASPSSVTSGASSTITAMGVSPANRPVTYTYSTTAGSVNGLGSTATLSTGGVPVGDITVTCNAVDDKGQTASSKTVVSVATPEPAAKPLTSDLCSIHFDRDAHRPSRVDNAAKACLDEIALNLQRSPDAQLAIVGNASAHETGANKLAAARAVNARVYLVGEKGIDGSRIVVYTGSQDGKIVTSTLVPSGATFDSTGDTLVR